MPYVTYKQVNITIFNKYIINQYKNFRIVTFWFTNKYNFRSKSSKFAVKSIFIHESNCICPLRALETAKEQRND